MGSKTNSTKECSGLYLLAGNNTPSGQALNSQSSSFYVSISNNDAMLWHFWLGHPNFVYLENLFTLVFKNKNPNLFKCSVPFFKTYSQYIQNQSYKPSHSLALIHNGMWGPSQVNHITRSCWFISFIDDHTQPTWIFLLKETWGGSHLQKLQHNGNFKQKFKSSE